MDAPILAPNLTALGITCNLPNSCHPEQIVAKAMIREVESLP